MPSAKGSSKRDARKKELAERARKAMQLRTAGATYEEVATALGFANKAHARDAIQKEIANIPKEAAEEVLALEIKRCDRLLRGMWEKASRGDSQAADVCLRIMARRAKYLGLDAPAKQEVSGPAGGPIITVTLDDIDAARLAAESNVKP